MTTLAPAAETADRTDTFDSLVDLARSRSRPR